MSLICDHFEYADTHHAHYLEHGHYIFDSFLTEEGLISCQQQVDRMLGQLHPGRDPGEIIRSHPPEPWMWELAREPKILDMIERQIGPNIVLWSLHLLCKPPGSGLEVPWHQDAPYWNVTGPLAPGVWIALDDMGEDNGAMAVLPRWHTKGKLASRTRCATTFDQEIDATALPPNIAQLKVQYRLPAGGLAIHDTMIPHSSRPNRSSRWRRVLVLRYMSAEGEMGPKMHQDYRTGQPFPRRFFLVRGQDLGHQELERNPYEPNSSD